MISLTNNEKLVLMLMNSHAEAHDACGLIESIRCDPFQGKKLSGIISSLSQKGLVDSFVLETGAGNKDAYQFTNKGAELAGFDTTDLEVELS